MALSRVKVWTNEILYPADLNAEFNNILNNPASLISPLTADFDLGGHRLTGVSAGTAGSAGMQLSTAANTGIYFPSTTSLGIVLAGTITALFDSAQSLRVLAGIAAAPAYSFIGDPDTGISNTSANRLDFSLGGYDSMVLRNNGSTLLSLLSNAATATGPAIVLYHASPSPETGDATGTLQFDCNDSNLTEVPIGQISMSLEDNTAGLPIAHMIFAVSNSGAVNVGAVLSSTGVWTDASSAAIKQYEGDFEDVTSKLKEISTLGVYRGKDRAVGSERHYSPTAEDFHEVFGLGDDRGIAPKDVAWLGVKATLEIEERVARIERFLVL